MYSHICTYVHRQILFTLWKFVGWVFYFLVKHTYVYIYIYIYANSTSEQEFLHKNTFDSCKYFCIYLYIYIGLLTTQNIRRNVCMFACVQIYLIPVMQMCRKVTAE